MAEDNEGLLEREKKLYRELGISPAIAAAAVYEGLPILTRPMLEDVPYGLTKFLSSGKPITAKAGTPLQQLAEFSRDEVKAIQNFARESGVRIPIVSTKDVPFGGQFADPTTPLSRLRIRAGKILGEKTVYSKTPSIGLATSSVPAAMHEIGHAKPIRGSVALRQIMHDVAANLGQRGMAGTLARMAIAGNVLAPPGEDTGKARRFLYENAPALVGATMVPEIIEEGRATMHALKGARKHGPGTLRAIKELAPAFGTYAAAAAAPILATLIAKKLVQALHRRKGGQEKQGVARPGTEIKASGRLRNSMAASKWLGTSFAKPRSTRPNTNPAARADETPKARPVSNRSYWQDVSKSLADPQRGFREAVQG